MNHKFLPHTSEDIQQMLDRIGIKDLDGLYAEVPESIRFKEEYELPEAMSELEIRAFFEKLGRKNNLLTCFAGGGVYDHYAPSVIPSLLGRSEFLTSYTPYQAEISQGTLHYIFEFQSMIAELTGMDIANASMYEGTTATAEARWWLSTMPRKLTPYCILIRFPKTSSVYLKLMHTSTE